ncbi:MAG TPA: VOC family protein [Longimicrobiales bacterium]|nr:VOC family protein [Longimicrobiales bacterium]
MSIQGLHHVTLIGSDAQRTVDFFAGALGLRLVKKTVDFDEPGCYHLYFGDGAGTPGTIVSCLEWPDAPAGHEGIGGTQHFALLVEDRAGLLRWKRRLVDLGIPIDGPLDRHYFESIYFHDPDGALIEIATRGPGWTRDEEPDRIGTEHREPPPEMLKGNRDQARIEADTWPEPVPEITPAMRLRAGLHHVTAVAGDIERTHAFLNGVLGLRRVKRTSNFDRPSFFHWYWGVGDGRPGTVVTYFDRNSATDARALIGPGQPHHYALAVEDDAALLDWRERLLAAGAAISPVIDRVYFRSIFTRDPDGQVVELATRGPGFTVDEPAAALGQRLSLPHWLEPRRAGIERRLRPLAAPAWTAD